MCGLCLYHFVSLYNIYIYICVCVRVCVCWMHIWYMCRCICTVDVSPKDASSIMCRFCPQRVSDTNSHSLVAQLRPATAPLRQSLRLFNPHCRGCHVQIQESIWKKIQTGCGPPNTLGYMIMTLCACPNSCNPTCIVQTWRARNVTMNGCHDSCPHESMCACSCLCVWVCVSMQLRVSLCLCVCVCRATLVATHLYIHSSISLWRLFSCLCSRQGSYLHVFLHLHFYVQQCHVNAGTMDNKLESIHNRLAMDTRTCFQLYQIVLEQSKHKHDMETTGFQRNHQNKSYVIMAWKQSSLPKMKWTK